MTSQQYDKDGIVEQLRAKIQACVNADKMRDSHIEDERHAVIDAGIDLDDFVTEFGDELLVALASVPESQPINAAPASATPRTDAAILRTVNIYIPREDGSKRMVFEFVEAAVARQLEREVTAHEAVRDACFEALGPECRVWGDVPGHIEELKRAVSARPLLVNDVKELEQRLRQVRVTNPFAGHATLCEYAADTIKRLASRSTKPLLPPTITRYDFCVATEPPTISLYEHEGDKTFAGMDAQPDGAWVRVDDLGALSARPFNGPQEL